MIHTSYFSAIKGRPDIAGRAVSVVMQQPPKFKLPVISDLAPSLGLYYKFRRKRISEGRFSQLYKMQLDLLDPDQVAQELCGKVLVSWEGYEDKGKTKLAFSHRHIIADWLKSSGHACEELKL